jgi:hypothetical protein
MKLGNEVVGNILTCLGTLNTKFTIGVSENPLCFFNDSDNLSIKFKSDSMVVYIKTIIPWDISIQEYYIYYNSLLVFKDLDLDITYDNGNIYFRSASLNIVNKELLDYYFDYSITEDINNLSFCNITNDYDKFYVYFKQLNYTIDRVANTFSNNIYIDNSNIFTTNKMVATWIKDSVSQFENNDHIVIDTSIISIYSNLKNIKCKDISFIRNTRAFGVYCETEDLKFYFLHSILNYKFPDFKRVFGKFEYTNKIQINKNDLLAVIKRLSFFDRSLDSVRFSLKQDSISVSCFSPKSGSFFNDGFSCISNLDKDVTLEFNISISNLFVFLNIDEDIIEIELNKEFGSPFRFISDNITKYISIQV